MSFPALLRSTLPIFLLTFIHFEAARAQNARQVVGGLLRELLESELERRDRNEENRTGPIDFERRPENDARGISDKSNRARGYFRSFTTESQQLARLLEQEARTTPGVRSHLDEVLKLRARADFLSQRYAQPQPDRVLLQDIQQLDRDWRLASYHFGNLPGLSNPCQQKIKRLDEINRQCCQLFDLGPQFDRREVVRLASALAAELNHLERDVEFELRSSPQARELISQLRRIEARAKLLGDSAADGDSYELVVAEFKRFVEQWTNLSRRLDRFNDRHIDRTVEEVHEINRRLHEQLLLPIRIDRSHLTHLTNQANRRLETLTESMTLAMLAELDNASGILDATRILCREMAHLQEAVAQNAPEAQLCEIWQVLDSAWREFDVYAQPIQSGRIRGLRQEIAALLDAMRRDLGVELTLDYRELLRLAAELEGITEQAEFHVEQWRRRPGARVDDRLGRDLQRFVSNCHRLHEDCADGVRQDQLARQCRELAEGWTRLRPQLLACNTADRHALRRISDQATQRLVRLQVMLEI